MSRFLAIYLNDHLAGSTGAIELVKRSAREHAGTELGSFLAGLVHEVQLDRAALKELMRAAGASPRRYKLVAAWSAERLGRLKLNGRVLRRSPLSPLVELEAMSMGIRGKELGWHALAAGPLGATHGDRLAELIERARNQQEQVEQHRRDASRDALRQ
jgi:hypothetical protein